MQGLTFTLFVPMCVEHCVDSPSCLTRFNVIELPIYIYTCLHEYIAYAHNNAIRAHTAYSYANYGPPPVCMYANNVGEGEEVVVEVHT